MINNVLPLILQTVTVIVAVATIMWRIQTRLNDRNAAAINAIQTALQKEIADVEEGLKECEKTRRSGDHTLHERVNCIESTYNKEITDRLSHIEGKLDGLSNISRVMEQWLIENGGKVT